EEIIFRGYLIEGLAKLTGRLPIAVVISVLAFTLPHILNWNITHVIGVVLPLGLILSWLYLWKRNIIFNMIVHIVIDLPLVFIALSSG
ncbi:MAG: CPBP family intramembrane glutamic endopeptidase, partial [Anaerolineales bacterium]|nr:CPBP family intramembrane glutamic endopeptidase [Anaerolineales bacterium]